MRGSAEPDEEKGQEAKGSQPIAQTCLHIG